MDRPKPERHPETRALREDAPPPPVGGDCYEAAGRRMLDEAGRDPRMRLVHAVCLIGAGPQEGVPFGHAWIERDYGGGLVLCHDVSNGRDLQIVQALYYAAGRPCQIHRYTLREARAMVVRHGHWGPWELEVDR